MTGKEKKPSKQLSAFTILNLLVIQYTHADECTDITIGGVAMSTCKTLGFLPAAV